MTNNEKFNQLLNSCQNPRVACSAPQALVGTGMLDKFREGAAV